MKKKVALLALALGLLTAALAFGQSAARENQFEGVWVAQEGADTYLIIFLDGLCVWIYDDYDVEVIPYRVSGDSLLLDGDPFVFTVVSNNRILLEDDLGVIVLDRQTSANSALLKEFGWIW
ncbi:MAG: hypothetical protein FWE09_04495 [Treponema sp.]|nr:hypothetical protein [Treponema sp.]